jgi:hypothetical protein
MLNIANLATASLAQLKSFASEHGINPVGDKRLLTTWRDAVQDFFAATAKEAVSLTQETIEGAIECAREVVTHDNTVVAANAAYTWTRKAVKFTVKAAWSSILVGIALICIAVDLWQTRSEVKEVLITVYRRQVSRMQDRWCIWREMGDAVIQVHVTERIVDYRERLQAMARAAAK